MCICACVRNFFLYKTSQKLLTGFLPNSTGMFLRQRLKTSLQRYRIIRPVERYRRSSASSYYKLLPYHSNSFELCFGIKELSTSLTLTTQSLLLMTLYKKSF